MNLDPSIIFGARTFRKAQPSPGSLRWACSTPEGPVIVVGHARNAQGRRILIAEDGSKWYANPYGHGATGRVE